MYPLQAKYAKLIEDIGRDYEAQEAPSGGLAPTPNETDQIEANRLEGQKETNGQLDELFEDLSLALINDSAYEADEKRELYAVVASIFA